MPPHPLTNFEIKEYYENEPRFNGVYSRDTLPKTKKSGAYVRKLDEYADVEVPKEIKKFIGHKNVKRNIFRINQTNIQLDNVWLPLHWIY